MKGSFLGKTENGSEIVKYALSDAKDVLRVLDTVNKAVEGYSFCKHSGNYMRYVSTSGSPVLLAGTSHVRGLRNTQVQAQGRRFRRGYRR